MAKRLDHLIGRCYYIKVAERATHQTLKTSFKKDLKKALTLTCRGGNIKKLSRREHHVARDKQLTFEN